jgi:hypothetical protein
MRAVCAYSLRLFIVFSTKDEVKTNLINTYVLIATWYKLIIHCCNWDCFLANFEEEAFFGLGLLEGTDSTPPESCCWVVCWQLFFLGCFFDLFIGCPWDFFISTSFWLCLVSAFFLCELCFLPLLVGILFLVEI